MTEKSMSQTPEEVESRVSSLEANMQHTLTLITSLGETVTTGFRETRETIESGQRRQDERTGEIHTRIDQFQQRSAERGRWNPTLVIAAITCSAVIGGIIVAFVNMSIAPIAKDDCETRLKIMDHSRLEDHPAALAKHARADEQLKDHQLEIEKLHRITDALISDKIIHARELGRLDAHLEAQEKPK